MCCTCSWPAGGNSASHRSRERWSGGVLDSAAEGRLQDASSEELQRPHSTGSQPTGKNVQVNLLPSTVFGETMTYGMLCQKHPFSVFKTSHMLEFSIIKDALGFWWWLTFVIFPLDISSLPNYWDGTLMSRYITSPENLLVDIIFINQAICKKKKKKKLLY